MDVIISDPHIEYYQKKIKEIIIPLHKKKELENQQNQQNQKQESK